jgi:hypothetical protein
MLTSIAGKLAIRCQKLDRMQATSEGATPDECLVPHGWMASLPPFWLNAFFVCSLTR